MFILTPLLIGYCDWRLQTIKHGDRDENDRHDVKLGSQEILAYRLLQQMGTSQQWPKVHTVATLTKLTNSTVPPAKELCIATRITAIAVKNRVALSAKLMF